jgi:hypothetical protein
MPVIRIPQEHWEEVWYFLTGTGPISRLNDKPIYEVSERQVRLLRKKKLPFEIVHDANGRARRKHA